MRVLNYGSVNVDHVYTVEHISRPGETIAAIDYQVFAGGKGANQSAALARAGADVAHAGRIGADGQWVLDRLMGLGVDTSLVQTVEEPTGHAIIQVDSSAQNSIVVYGGANRRQTPGAMDAALSVFDQGDILLLQNEINDIAHIMSAAAGRGLRIYFNPAPFTEDVRSLPLHTVDTLLLNEAEAADLTGVTDADQQLRAVRERWPAAGCLLTLGEDGVEGQGTGWQFRHPAVRVPAVDTTGAGDTFIGYYVAGIASGYSPVAAADRAVRAAAICVTRAGAMDSIPAAAELSR